MNYTKLITKKLVNLIISCCSYLYLINASYIENSLKYFDDLSRYIENISDEFENYLQKKN